jgi:putative ABC transport system permease protein
MISLAGRDILHAWGKFVFTGVGLGLLIGVTLVMAGVYRGMVDDGKALLDNSGADLWVVQKDTLGSLCGVVQLNDDVYRSILAMPGVAQAANVTYLTMQVRKGESDVRAMVVGIAPGKGMLHPDGRLISWPGARSRAVTTRRWPISPPASGSAIARHSPQPLHRRGADPAHGVIQRRPDGIHSAQGRPGGAVPQGQRCHLAKPSSHRGQSGLQSTRRAGPAGCRDRFTKQQSFVNAVLVTLKPGHAPDEVAESIRRWKRLTVYTRRRWKAFSSAS